jgi:hypothetical protein
MRMKFQCLFLLFSFTFTLYSAAQTKANPTNKSQKKSSLFSYVIIDAPEKTFGYNIYLEGRLKIHQPFMPAVQGVNGFKTKLDAEKVAKLAIKKMKQGQIPPEICIEEMKKLKVL